MPGPALSRSASARDARDTRPHERRFCSLAAHGAPLPHRRPPCAAQTKTETRLSPIKPCRQSIMGRRAGRYLAGRFAGSPHPIRPCPHHHHSAAYTQPAGQPSARSTGGLCHLADERRTRGAPGSILYAARDVLTGTGRADRIRAGQNLTAVPAVF